MVPDKTDHVTKQYEFVWDDQVMLSMIFPVVRKHSYLHPFESVTG